MGNRCCLCLLQFVNDTNKAISRYNVGVVLLMEILWITNILHSKKNYG